MKIRTRTALIAEILALAAARQAYADSNPANDSGSFTVRVTPNVELGVTVDTTGANWLGFANLDNTRQLDTDEIDAVDEVRLYAMFGKYDFSLPLDSVDYDGIQNLLKTSATRAGQPEDDEFSGDSNHVYELPTSHTEYGGGDGDMDGMPSTATRSLWLRARTPGLTTTDQQAAFTVTVTAVTGENL